MKRALTLAALLLAATTLSPLRAAEPTGPVKIGVLADMSGVYAGIGGMGSVEAVKMAVADAGGSALGQPIEIVYADSENKADKSTAIARQWFDQGVDMITDLPSSGMALAVMEVGREKHRLVLVSSAGTSEVTGKSCSPYAAHWAWDTYSMAHGTGTAIARQPDGKNWYFLTADYVFGKSLQADATSAVQSVGGKVIGASLAPFGTNDFSSYLLQVQGSGAQVLGLANAGTDLINTMKQLGEYHILDHGMRVAMLIAFLSDIHAIGLDVAQGTLLTESFYWDQDDATRAFGNRFYAVMKRMPTMTVAGSYSATAHYLKAVKALGSKDPDKVMEWMRANPINDFMSHNATLRIDGQVMRDMYLFQVKKPSESRGEWDLYKQVATIPAVDAYRPLSEGGCPLVK
jgi:branched-chain amino acid transport system substrate-binding protein